MSILSTDLPPVRVAGVELTGDQLRAAAGLVAAQVQDHQVVAIEANPSVQTVVAAVGCLLAGVPFVPVPPDAGVAERTHLLNDSGAELWLSTGDDAPADVHRPVLAVETRPNGSAEQNWVEPVDGTAMLLYTSGTTGSPKGVVISRRAIRACLDGLRAAWNWTSDDVLVHGLPLFHVHGLVLGVLGALRFGSRLLHTGRPTAAGYAAAAEAGGTLFFGVPTVWSRIAAEPGAARQLREARLLVSGSAGLPAPTFAALQELAGQGPVERYGMTETLITVASRAGDDREPGWVGRPIDGVQTRVTDEQGRLCPAGELGRLEVRGTTLFDGYLHQLPGPDHDHLPHDHFPHDHLADDQPGSAKDGWFDTGDAAVIGADGRHKIIGRVRDDLISSGGYRIGAGEIEAVILSHPAVQEVAVVGEPDPDLGQRIVAYVVGERVEPNVLIDLVAGQLSAHKRPREVRFVDALPRNAMGKVRKSVLVR